MTHLATMSPRQRLWMTGGTLAGFVVALIGYFVLIGPQRADTASVDSRVNSTRTSNTALRAHIIALQAQNRNRATYEAQARAAMTALPATSGLPAFLRTLQTLGARTNTDAVNVSVGAPTDVTAIATGTATGTATAAAPTTATPTTATSAVAAANQVYSLPITVQVNGSPTALGQFLEQLQGHQPRAVLITQIVEGSGSNANGAAVPTGSNLQLTMQAFVAPSASTGH